MSPDQGLQPPEGSTLFCCSFSRPQKRNGFKNSVQCLQALGIEPKTEDPAIPPLDGRAVTTPINRYTLHANYAPNRSISVAVTRASESGLPSASTISEELISKNFPAGTGLPRGRSQQPVSRSQETRECYPMVFRYYNSC
jgi:hypothetical protein